MIEDNDKARRAGLQVPGEPEWALPAGYKTRPCKHCGALVAFTYAGGVKCLDVEKSHATKSGRLLAPRHRCQEGVGPRG